ncbi:MAG: zinc-binding alcohol dehydrogenase [Lentisphaeria bacterium]|nr:zinc-binding alcohol dehydrogenase [Lentisphaeria bacterium]
MKEYSIWFEEKERASLRCRDFSGELTGSQVLVKADYSVISAGTELANYHALPNTSIEGHPCTYPRHPGYSGSGHVIAVGPDAVNLKIGDNVAVVWSGHKNYFVQDEDFNLHKLPDGVDLKSAAFTHVASFPLLGVRKLQIQLGEAVMVAGLGLLGLIAVQAAKLSGAYPVLACDFSEERRNLALQLGADYALDPREEDFIGKVRALTDGKGPAATVEVTGTLPGLQRALEYTAFMGRIVILGCTRISDQPINVYRYIHGKGLHIIGSHDRSRPQAESHQGAWTARDDYKTFFKLIAAGAMKVFPLINKVVSPLEAEAVYREIGFGKNPPLGVLFDWQNFE